MPDLTPQQPIDPADQKPTDEQEETPQEEADELKKKIEKSLKSRVESSKRNRRQFTAEWKRNVELRIGHVGSQYTGGLNIEDEVQTEINPDWSLTKTKTANLYSQVPTIMGTHENKKYAPAVAPFLKELNYQLGEKRMNVGVCMEEAINDTSNASGIAAVFVEYVARFDKIELPASDGMIPTQTPVVPPVPPPVAPAAPPMGAAPMPGLGMPPAAPMSGAPPAGAPSMPPAAPVAPATLPVDRPVDYKFTSSRLSPTTILWPSEFVGSNFDDGDYIGHTDGMVWAMAKNEFKLDEEEKDTYLVGGELNTQDSLKSTPDKQGLSDAQKVMYDEVFYWRHRFDPDCLSFKEIWRIVYVHGKEEPVVHERWKGQKYDENTHKYVGNCKFPIRVLTLTYITDNPVPPSDSSAGRPQVNDLRRSRSQMFQNRERSIPIRGFDTNRIDVTTANRLMAGTYQGWIPVNGRGQDSIWEVARASYPAEDMSFDNTAMSDLKESWGLTGQTGERQPKQTSAGVQAQQQSFATRIGLERGRVAAFFLGIAEILAGYMVLYSDFPSLSDEEKQAMEKAWDSKHILHDLVFKLLPDSTIMLDSQQQIQKLMQFLNMTVKSGFVNPLPIITKIAELSGLDPAEVVIKPEPKQDEPNISYRFSGKDDLMNPLVVAMLIKAKQMPTMQELEEAKKLLQAVGMPVQPPAPAAPNGAPGGPAGSPSAHPPAAGGPPGSAELPPHPEGGLNAHPGMALADKVAKRSRDI